MPSHRTIVALGFRIVGGCIGVPSFLASLALTVAAFDLHRATPPTAAEAPLDVQKYGLAGLLTNVGSAVGHGLARLAAAAEWAMVALATTAFITALAGLCAYLIGWGLGRGALWARLLAGLVAGLTGFVAFGALASAPRAAAPVAAPLLALDLYLLWVVSVRFA